MEPDQSFISEFLSLFTNPVFLGFLNIVWSLAFIWLPLLLFYIAFNLWIRYANKKYILEREYHLLEIKLPMEIEQTPKAMEIVFNGIHIGPSVSTWWDRIVKGAVLPWWSFEIVSIGGDIHFYVWCREDFKDITEAQIYAQYPDVQIVEVEEDYARKLQYVPGETEVFGGDFVLSKPDAYPIKTYVDYGLDAPGLESTEKPDPLASVLEFLSSIELGEVIAFQILIQQTKDRDRKKPKTFFSKEGWRDSAERLIKELRKTMAPDDNEEDKPGYSSPTRVQSEILTAIERSIGKLGFEAGMRGIYWAEEEKFKSRGIRGMLSSVNHYSSKNLNNLKPTRFNLTIDYPWQDLFDIRENRYKKQVLEAYRKRSWFNPPYKFKPYILTSEELATLYHFPGQVARAPGIHRMSSKRSDAPTNLPL